MDNLFSSIDAIGRALENQLDFDFSVNEKRIDSLSEFESCMKEPFYDKNKKIFYRGERINNPLRTLIPSMLRDKNALFSAGEVVKNIDSEFLLEYYKGKGAYFDLFKLLFGRASKYRLYELCAFSQHYLGLSPFIDFTKSIYVALSFALKNRKQFEDDIVVYTIELSNHSDYTRDMVTAECWLNDYKVTLYNSPEKLVKQNKGIISPSKMRGSIEAMESGAKGKSPKAKFIDIPTNDLMKYQQGVFLLLTDYRLFYKAYLTKNIRDDFKVTKYIINKEICPDLLKLISEEAPWYEYDCLLDIKKAVLKAGSASSEYRILQQNGIDEL